MGTTMSPVRVHISILELVFIRKGVNLGHGYEIWKCQNTIVYT